ncbi:MAG: beta family protein [Acidobacteria bacterium]|nr:beta family protein [Acidobacteriota bacterium]
MSHLHLYIPILKGRAGEFGALQAMSLNDKQGITPLIEIPPIPWDYKDNKPEKTIDQHLLKVGSHLERSWGQDSALFIDSLWIGEAERMAGGEHPVTHLLRKARERAVKTIPVTGLLRGDEYQLAVRDSIAMDRRGACLRLQREDFNEFEDLDSQISTVLENLAISPSECDLILDLRALTLPSGPELTANVCRLINRLPHLNQWRSFMLAGTAFPVDLMGVQPSQVCPIPRHEWLMWSDLVMNKRVERLPIFADYAIAHPQPSEVDPRIMRASASIRYTTEASWLILKGKNLKDYGYKQFHLVSKHLLNNPAYSGPQFSWGDQYVQECAKGRASCGNLTTWRKVGTSHHIAYVMQQLANRVAS